MSAHYTKLLLVNEKVTVLCVNIRVAADGGEIICIHCQGVFMYVTNLEDYGHLVDPDFFPTKYLYNDMWQMKANRRDWEQRYISPEYWQALNPNTLNEMVSYNYSVCASIW